MRFNGNRSDRHNTTRTQIFARKIGILDEINGIVFSLHIVYRW
jgi:hypothetical protein